jgi:ribonuclease HI
VDVKIYTDGAARGNPGRGGYGVVLLSGNLKKEISKGYRLTTNNRMEIMGVIAGLEALKKKGMNVTIYSDSQYVVKAVKEKWLNKWMATNFAKGIKNKDLWVKFYNLAQDQNLNFVWVKGHAENVYNNRCDELACAAADGKDLDVDKGYEIDPGKLIM